MVIPWPLAREAIPFEYLNRFVANWRYTGISDFDAVEYTFFATLAFSTVLPAVISTAEWLSTFPRLNTAFGQWRSVLIPRPRLAAGVVLVVTTVSLCALGVFSEYVFPLVWISPVLVIICLQALGGRPTVLAPLARGDWLVYGLPAASELASAFAGLAIYVVLMVAAGLFDLNRRNL